MGPPNVYEIAFSWGTHHFNFTMVFSWGPVITIVFMGFIKQIHNVWEPHIVCISNRLSPNDDIVEYIKTPIEIHIYIYIYQ